MRIRTLLVMLAGASLAVAQTANSQATPAGRAAGEKIFRSHCASCHGVAGAGGTGPNLTTGVFYHGNTDADLYKNISQGIEGTAMPDQFFNGVQIWQIVAYVRSLSATPVRTKLPGNAAHGAELFRAKGCSGCHLVKGEGGVRGPDLSIIGSQRSAAHLRESITDPGKNVSNAYWVAKVITKDGKSHSGFLLNQDTYAIQMLDFAEGLRTVNRSDFNDFGIDRSSIMPAYQDKLGASELDDLVAFLASLERSRFAQSGEKK